MVKTGFENRLFFLKNCILRPDALLCLSLCFLISSSLLFNSSSLTEIVNLAFDNVCQDKYIFMSS